MAEKALYRDLLQWIKSRIAPPVPDHIEPVANDPNVDFGEAATPRCTTPGAPPRAACASRDQGACGQLPRGGVPAPAPHVGPPLTPDELRTLAAEEAGAPRLGRVEVFEEFAAGLTDVEDHERLYLLFWVDESRPSENLRRLASGASSPPARRAARTSSGSPRCGSSSGRATSLWWTAWTCTTARLLDIKPVLGFADPAEH